MPLRESGRIAAQLHHWAQPGKAVWVSRAQWHRSIANGPVELEDERALCQCVFVESGRGAGDARNGLQLVNEPARRTRLPTRRQGTREFGEGFDAQPTLRGGGLGGSIGPGGTPSGGPGGTPGGRCGAPGSPGVAGRLFPGFCGSVAMVHLRSKRDDCRSRWRVSVVPLRHNNVGPRNVVTGRRRMELAAGMLEAFTPFGCGSRNAYLSQAAPFRSELFYRAYVLCGAARCQPLGESA